MLAVFMLLYNKKRAHCAVYMPALCGLALGRVSPAMSVPQCELSQICSCFLALLVLALDCYIFVVEAVKWLRHE